MKIPLLVFAVAALVLPSMALAAKKDTPKATKPTLIGKYDTNKNGQLDADELEQIKSDYLADPKGELRRLDHDHDGKLSDAELAPLLGTKKAEAGDKKPGARKKKPAV
jgi:Ca2+-binding EF-hand superfamily protein